MSLSRLKIDGVGRGNAFGEQGGTALATALPQLTALEDLNLKWVGWVLHNPEVGGVSCVLWGWIGFCALSSWYGEVTDHIIVPWPSSSTCSNNSVGPEAATRIASALSQLQGLKMVIVGYVPNASIADFSSFCKSSHFSGATYGDHAGMCHVA